MQSLLSVHLDDEQVDELNAALCAYRDHFVELIELNAGAEGPQARENANYWNKKIREVQDLIDQISDSIYGTRGRMEDS
ncbi:hypothetical protein [Glutamicibacter arilaitensis]|uniref:hypothetical protein n=1 Tax=Glutamicibacter arilaitensis TaxID=256701 RepID=UPI003A9191BD